MDDSDAYKYPITNRHDAEKRLAQTYNGGRTESCASCDTTFVVGGVCPTCTTDGSPSTMTDTAATSDWDIDGVIYALIEGGSEHTADSLGRGALKKRAGRPHLYLGEDEGQDLYFISEMDEQMLAAFSKKWEALPGFADATEPEATTAIENIIEKMESGEPSDPIVYDRYGSPLSSTDKLEAALEAGAGEYWLVGAVALNPPQDRSEHDPSKTQANNHYTTLACISCEADTKHKLAEFSGPKGQETPQWECTRCGYKQPGPNPLLFS